MRTLARPVRATTALVLATMVLWTFVPCGRRGQRPGGHDAVPGGRRRARHQGQLRPESLVDTDGERGARDDRRAGGLDSQPARGRVRGRWRVRHPECRRRGPPRCRRAGRCTGGTTTLRLTARGGGAQDVLPIAIRTNAEAAGDVALTTSTPTLTGASDATFTFDLQYKNDTAQDLTVSVTATGPDGWDVSAALTGQEQAASTVVDAGATQNISVTANAPKDITAGRIHQGRSQGRRPNDVGRPRHRGHGLVLDDAVHAERPPVGERLGRIPDEPGVRDREHRNGSHHRGRAHRNATDGLDGHDGPGDASRPSRPDRPPPSPPRSPRPGRRSRATTSSRSTPRRPNPAPTARPRSATRSRRRRCGHWSASASSS